MQGLLNVVIITVSDRCSRGEAVDESGPLAATLCSSIASSVRRCCVGDEKRDIIAAIEEAKREEAHLVITTGGTGFSERDVTPEATLELLDKHAAAFAQAIVSKGLEKTPYAALSRGIVGVSGKTLVVNLPGSTKAVRDGMEVVVQLAPHAVALLNPTQFKVEHSGGHTCTGACGHSHPKMNPERSSPYPMVSLKDARTRMVTEAAPLPAEPVPLWSSSDRSNIIIGRILAEDVFAKEALPHFVASIKDGYAAKGPVAADTKLKVVGSIQTGDEEGLLSLGLNEAVYITTGAPLPSNADTVIMIELTREGNDESIECLADVAIGTDVRPPGADIAAGERVLEAGTRIGPGEVSVLATVGHEVVLVHQRPRVGVLSSGNEVVSWTTKELHGSCIRDANRPALLSALASSGLAGAIIDGGIVRDVRDEVSQRLSSLLDNCDVVITSGGVSMGKTDHFKDVLLGLGFSIHFGRIAMKPGKPFTFATTMWKDQGKRYVLSVPGNPASAFVCFHTFGIPLLRVLGGSKSPDHVRVHATTLHSIKPDAEREELQRAIVTWNSETKRYEARTTGIQNSSRPTSLVANAFLELPAKDTVLPAGTVLVAILL